MKTLPALAVTAIAAATTAQAGGFYLQEQSPLGLGRAFAGEAAAADSAATVYFNPAGMTQLAGNHVLAGVHLLLPDSRQQDRGSTRGLVTGGSIPTGGGDGGNPFDSVVPIPSTYGSFQITDRLWFGLGLSSPFGLKVIYDDGWFGRYDSIKSDLFTINIQPSAAFKLTDALSIGVGFNGQYIDAELTNALPNLSPAQPDALLRIKGDDFSLGWNAGILYSAGTIRAGAHFRSGVSHRLQGALSFSGLLGPLAGLNGQSAGTAPIDLPDLATLGLVVGQGKRLRILSSATWYNWSSFDRIVVLNSDGEELLESPQNYRDTWGGAVAVEYDLNERLTIRAGTMYDETPTTDAFRTTRVPDGDRTWATAGLSWRLSETITADVSYAHVFVTSETINRSDPLFEGTPVETDLTIASRNSGNVDILGMALRASF